MIIPLILLVSMFSLLFFGGSEIAFFITAILGSMCGVYIFLNLIRNPGKVKFTRVMAVSLLLGYAFSAALYGASSFIVNSQFDFTDHSMALIGYSQDDLSNALLLVYAESLFLLFLAKFEKPAFKEVQSIDYLGSKHVNLMVTIGVVVLIVAIILGDFGYMGTQVDELSNITIIGSMAFFLAPIILPIAILGFLEARVKPDRIWLGVAVIFLLLVLFVLGRRVLLYSVVVSLVMLAASGRNIKITSPKRWVLFGFLFVGISIIFYIGSNIFYALRLAHNIFGEKVGIFELASKGFELLQYDRSYVANQLSENQSSRVFILSYLAGLLSVLSSHSSLWGKEFIYAVLIAVPSLLFPQKASLIPGASEDIVHPALGVAVFDGPSTVMTAGLVDFWIFGALLYPVILVMLYVLVRRLLVGRLPPILYLLVMLRLIYQLFYVEQSLSGLLTTGLRDIFLFTVFFYFVYWLLGSASSSSSISLRKRRKF